jgi:hypothetical protein
MSENLKRKLELTFVGYLFVLLNLASTIHNFPIVGIFFGLVAMTFFVRALLIKEK